MGHSVFVKCLYSCVYLLFSKLQMKLNQPYQKFISEEVLCTYKLKMFASRDSRCRDSRYREHIHIPWFDQHHMAITCIHDKNNPGFWKIQFYTLCLM